MAVAGGFFGSGGGVSAGGGGFFGGGSGVSSGNLNQLLGGVSGITGGSTVDPSELTPGKMLQGVARLYHSGNPEQQAQAQKYLHDNAAQFTDADLAEYNLERPETDDKSLFQKAVGTGWSGVKFLGGVLGRPQQGIESGLQNMVMAPVGALGVGINRATGGHLLNNYDADQVQIGDIPANWWRRTKAGVQRVTDISGKHDMNLRQVMGGEGDEGGNGWFGKYVVEPMDVIGGLALDPLSYVGAPGAREGAEAGLAAFEKVEPGLSDAIRGSGKAAVTDEQIGKALKIATDDAKAAGAGQRGRLMSTILGGVDKTGGPFSQFKEGALLGSAGQDIRTGLERFRPQGLKDLLGPEYASGAGRAGATDVLHALSRGQEGVHLFGETVLPKLGRASLLSKAGLTSKLIETPNRLREIADKELTTVHNQQVANAERIAAIGKPTASQEAELAQLHVERQELAERFHEANTLKAEAERGAERVKTPNEEWERTPKAPFFGSDIEPTTPRGIRTTPDGGREMVAHLPNGEEVSVPILRDSDGAEMLNRTMDDLHRKYMEAGGDVHHWVDNVVPSLTDRTNAPDRLGQHFWHGTSKELPENLANLEDRQVDPIENIRGPGIYLNNRLDTTAGYMTKGGGNKPTRYLTRWLGSDKPRFFDLEKTASQGGEEIPENVINFMKGHLEEWSDNAHAANPVDENAEGMYHPADQFDEVMQDLDDPEVNMDTIYEAFKDAASQAVSDMVDDGTLNPSAAQEHLEDIMYGVSEKFADAGYHGFTHESGWRTGSAPGRTHIVFNPRGNIEHIAMPPESIPHTELPEGYHEATQARAEAKAALDEHDAKLAKSKRKVFLRDTESVQKAHDEAAGALEEQKATKKVIANARKAQRETLVKVDLAEQRLQQFNDKVAEARAAGEKPLRGEAEQRRILQAAVDEHTANMEGLDRVIQDQTQRLRPATEIERHRGVVQDLKPVLKKNLARDAKASAKAEAQAEKLAGKEASLSKFLDTAPLTSPERIEGKLTPAGDFLRGLFKSDAGLEVRHGRAAREAAHSLEETAQGTSTQNAEHMLRSIENTLNAGKKESKGFVDELAARVYPAMETGGAEALADAYRAEGRPKAAQYVDNLIAVRNKIDATNRASGALDEGAHDINTWMPRILTGDAAKAWREYKSKIIPVEGSSPASDLVADLHGEGSTLARKLDAESPLTPEFQAKANEQLRGVAPGFKKDAPVFQTNPSTSLGSAAITSERRAAKVQMLRDMTEIKDVHGAPLVTTDKNLAKTLGYDVIDAPGEKMYAPPEVHRTLSRFQDVVTNDESLKRMQRGLNKTMRIWKAQATVPLIGFAFHTRNAETNVLLNWVAGLQNPVWYTRAAGLQRKISKAAKLLGEDGAQWEDILKSDLFTEHERMIVKEAMNRGVLQSDYVGHGLESSESIENRMEARNVSRARKIVRKGKFWNTDQALGVNSGRATGRWVENNARLGHFMWATDKYGNLDVAANSVRKYLFNYNDLTPFERKLKENYIPFYTFMRKNLGLMLDTLKENPGKLRRFTMAEQATENQNAPWLKDMSIPAYAILGQGGGQAPRFGDTGPLSNIMTSVESPMSSAMDTVMPAIQGAKLTPGLGRAIPDAMANPEGGAGVARDLLNLPGGPPAQALRFAMGKAYDVDPFTGGYAPRQGNMDKALALTDILAVSPSKFARTLDKFALSGRKNEDFTPAERGKIKEAAIINLLTGLNASAVTETGTKQVNKNRWYQQIKDYIDHHNRGLDADDPRRIKTLDELGFGPVSTELPPDPFGIRSAMSFGGS